MELLEDTMPVRGWRLIELFWPMNDMFRRRLPAIRAQPYDVAFEEEADAAILALQDADGSDPWRSVSTGAWRVLLERHQQLMVVALANEREQNPVTYLPDGLSEDDQRIGLALLLLLRMKLPFPVADRSALDLPSAPPDWRSLGH